MGFLYAHYIWILPVQTALITYLTYQRIGLAAFIGVACQLLQTMPVMTMLSRLLSRLRLRIAVKSDERVRIMNEIVQGIQVIKMYAWELFFKSIVVKVRDEELKYVKYASYIRGFNLVSYVITDRITLFVTIIACAIVGQSTTAEIVFSLTQYFSSLKVRSF